MKKTSIRLLVLTLISVLILDACNLPSKGDEANTGATTVAETTAAVFTRAAETATASTPPETPTPINPTVTTVPTNTLFPTQAATATKTPIPCNKTSFVKDVTVPDNTVVEPGEVFTKTWRLQNNGSCTWTSGYVLLFNSGDQMNAPATASITGGSVAPGSTVDISVELTAPTTPGTYQGNFKLRSPDNIVFGINADGQGPFWVKVVVAEPTATPTATATDFPTLPPPPPPLHSSGSLNINSSYTFDLDEGTTPGGGNEDFQFRAVTSAEKYITSKNSAIIVDMGVSAPSKAQCDGISIGLTEIPLSSSLVNHYFCYATNLHRSGYFKITSYDGSILSIDYATWE